ncbi:hypothetical protein [Myxosarcina sp. GI1(2024)]
MLDKHKHKANWHQVIGGCMLTFGAFLSTTLPANALPEIPQQLAQVRSRAIAPTPLNITPLPGRHISLPRDRSSYRDYYRGYDLNRRFRHRYLLSSK